ncbi:MAG: glycosyltransferase family 2 protein [Bacteroidia bacterium]|jgi:glycosyltransferase involved in cell wall biosynthesis
MTPISVVIITLNEAANIGRCIQSVLPVADEVVVVDSFSTDQTCALAETLGAKIVQRTFDGHIEQKNYAITQAKFPFILSLDADEWLSDELTKAILKIKENPMADGYRFNRLNNYCGTWIRHGAWYPDRKLRLWDSRMGKWEGMNPHDEFRMVKDAVIKNISCDILHQSYRTVDEHRNKSEYFSTLASRAYHKHGKRATFLNVLLSPAFRFLRDYFFLRGFMDGKEGLRIALLTAREVKLKYTKLLELQPHRPDEEHG